MSAAPQNDGDGLSRRGFLAQASALATASVLGLPTQASADPPPETRKIRLYRAPTICLAPSYLAEELLLVEGFSEVEYIEPESTATIGEELAKGRFDIGMKTAPYIVPFLDSGAPLVVLAGVHAGCYELFGNDRVRSIRDLKGKAIAISAYGTSEHIFVSTMLAYVGINPRKEVNWILGKTLPDTMQIFVDGRADAFLAFAPQPQELRGQNIGTVIVNTTEDRPWSQYFCCVVSANRDFIAKHPVATKRALRAILKAADICADDPERVARFVVAKGYEPRYDVALNVIKSLPYRRWRDGNPEDTLRFHALRLHEVGMIKTNPNKLIAQGTDWRFLNDLKKELKS
jgi:NitT/TauT family transport system substrate-binding protein